MPKLYQNVGLSSLHVGGEIVPPGEKFEGMLEPEYETFLTTIGALAILKDSSKSEDEALANFVEQEEKAEEESDEPGVAARRVRRAAKG